MNGIGNESQGLSYITQLQRSSFTHSPHVLPAPYSVTLSLFFFHCSVPPPTALLFPHTAIHLPMSSLIALFSPSYWLSLPSTPIPSSPCSALPYPFISLSPLFLTSLPYLASSAHNPIVNQCRKPLNYCSYFIKAKKNEKHISWGTTIIRVATIWPVTLLLFPLSLGLSTWHRSDSLASETKGCFGGSKIGQEL